MSAWYMLLDSKFADRKVGGAMGNQAGRKRFSVLVLIKSWIARRQAIKDLEALGDRLLSDIGISRYEIPAIVDRVRTAANVYRNSPAPVTLSTNDDEVLAA